MLKLFNSKNKQQKFNVDETLEVARGGEGRIIPIGNNKVVKLYFVPTRAISDAKIDELSTLNETLFLKPKIPVSGDANGFIMDELNTNEYFPLYSLFSPNFIMKHNLPSNFKMKIGNKLIDAVRNAHDNNIVIGDLNPFNIMVNDQLDVKFIDVDSYQTITSKHNDKLLEDIRDYFYNGVVSKNSDFFSLSVIIFNLFTYIHPYKGFHSVYGNNIKDRMINNVSIISNEEKNIKIPKFYHPIADDNLLETFKRIFNKNERFIIDLCGTTVKTITFDGVIISDNLIINNILTEQIVNVTTSKNFMCVVTKKHTLLFNTPSKGVVTNLLSIENDVNIILTDKNVFGFKDGILKIFNKKLMSFDIIKDIVIKDIYCVKQFENILLVITKNDDLYKLYLDEVFNNSIKYGVIKVYHKSFHKTEGLFQHIGTYENIMYNNGTDISYIKFDGDKIHNINQIGNVGIITSISKNKLKYELFTINKMGKVKLVELPDNYQFTANDNFIILYDNTKLRFINKETLIEIASFNADGLDGYSLLSTNSGIVAFNQNNVKILNSK